MPLYEYECEACGERFERIQKFSDPLVEICPNCGKKKVHKLMSSPAIQFKGSGFYINDYARKSDGGTDSAKNESAKGESGKAESSKAPAADTKSGDKPAAAAPATSTRPASTTKE